MRLNMPSVFFMMLALVTMATLVLPFSRAYSKAARTMRRVPASVVTLKSMERSSQGLMPWLPSTYSPSVFSR